MNIIDFDINCVSAAEALAALNYAEERAHLPILPDISAPGLNEFAENGMGVAAYDGGEPLGFLCAFEPWDNAFGTLARGTFTPLHAHGAVKRNREMIYKRLYQAAAEKWVARGAYYHGASLYAHDGEAISALFTYGFGMRCVDGMRDMTPINCIPRNDVEFRRLSDDEKRAVRPLRLALSNHMGASPCFMRSTAAQAAEHAERAEARALDIFVAVINGEIAAFIDGAAGGETFSSEAPDVRNICGAYCLPEYRGGDLFINLINHMIKFYAQRGFTRLGVDYESFNPTGNAFWGRHFTPYTRSLTRRIDELYP